MSGGGCRSAMSTPASSGRCRPTRTAIVTDTTPFPYVLKVLAESSPRHPVAALLVDLSFRWVALVLHFRYMPHKPLVAGQLAKLLLNFHGKALVRVHVDSQPEFSSPIAARLRPSYFDKSRLR